MTFIMVTSKYPLHKADEVIKVFLEKKLPEVPDYMKRISIWGVADFGPKNYSVYEVPNDKLHDAILALATRYNGFRKIKGFKYKIEPLATVEESLPTFKPV